MGINMPFFETRPGIRLQKSVTAVRVDERFRRNKPQAPLGHWFVTDYDQQRYVDDVLFRRVYQPREDSAWAKKEWDKVVQEEGSGL